MASPASGLLQHHVTDDLPDEKPMTVRRRILALLTMTTVLAGAAHAGDVATPWHDARQMVLVTTADWNADHGTLRTFVRDGEGWREERAATAVTIGKNGAAWGLGLNAAQTEAGGPLKRDGDNRSSAGIFRIGAAFGYAAHVDTAMPYLALTATDWCVDVNGAAHYNRIVDTKVVGTDAVKGSSEPMRRDLHLNGDQHYRMGFVIEQNPQNVPGAGSCIFAHLWGSPTTPTAGCTAMTPAVMQSLLAWLKPEDHPVFVLLPRGQYDRLRAEWQLPRIADGSTAE
jgi:L,D-peptidoglycan transpeptidase YkuD (ErfK/YbiS/YcfS/YnhG family)